MFKNKTTQIPIKQLSNRIRPGILDSYGLIHSEKRWHSPSSNAECEPEQTKLIGHMESFLDVVLV